MSDENSLASLYAAGFGRPNPTGRFDALRKALKATEGAISHQADQLVVREQASHYYPPEIIDLIYGAGDELVIEGDRISRNAVTYTKNELAEKVLLHLTPATRMHTVFEEQLLALTDAKAA